MSGDTNSTPLTAEGISLLASFVIRPPRATYHRRDLGRRRFNTQTPRSVSVTRTDLQLVNARGQTLQCSHYVPELGEGSEETRRMPAVVYLHGNGSCRVEAEILFDHLLPYGMSVFAFDFSGSGKSDGQYISLGVFEKFDVETVVTYLSTCEHVSSIALWGHSMGAATATMYAGLVDSKHSNPTPVIGNGRFRTVRSTLPRPRSLSGGIGLRGRRAEPTPRDDTEQGEQARPPGGNPADSNSSLSSPSDTEDARPQRQHARVKALVLDSAFASFGKLAVAMVDSMPLPAAFPKRLVLSVGIRAVRKAVRDRAGFDVYDIDPLSACKSIDPDIPALFLQGTDDEIVHLSHAKLLEEAYPGPDKKLIVMQSIDHDAPRPSFALEEAFILLQRTLFDDGGSCSPRFINALKLRGNDAMVDGRFKDAVFLYTTALSSIVDLESMRSKLSGSDASREKATTLEPFAADGQASSRSLVANEGNSGASNLWPDSEDDHALSGPAVVDNESTPLRGPRVARRISTRISSKVGGAFSGVTRKLGRRASAAKREQNDMFNQEAGALESDPPQREEIPGDLVNESTEECPQTALSSSDTSAQGMQLDAALDANANGVTDAGPASTSRFRRPRIVLKRRSSGRRNSTAPQGLRGRRRRTDSELSSDSSGNIVSQVSALDELIRLGQLSAELSEVTLALLGNRSLAQLKMKDCENALRDADLALALDPSWARAYQRKATTLKTLGRIDDARLCVMEGLRHAPSSAALVEIEVELEEEALAIAMAASLADQDALSQQRDSIPSTDAHTSSIEICTEPCNLVPDARCVESSESAPKPSESSSVVGEGESQNRDDTGQDERSALEPDRVVESPAC